MIQAKYANVLITVAVALSLLFAGFSVARAQPAKQPAKAPKIVRANACAKSKRIKAKGQVRFSDWQFPDTFNGYQAGGLLVTQLNKDLIAEGYFSYNQKSARVPVILATTPTVKNKGIQNGGKTITIHLKPHLYWSNGTEITSADVKFGWKIDSDPVTGPACAGTCDNISRIDTPNKYTAVFHAKRVDADFLNADLPDFWPTSWHNAAGGWSKNDAHGAATTLADNKSFNFQDDKYPTNGPYVVSSWVTNDRITYKPMKYYNNLACGASVANIIFAFYSSKPDLEAAAATRNTDTTTDYTWPDVADLQKHTDAYKLSVIPAFVFEHFEFNTDATYKGQPNPTSNANVRLALALALDKRGLIQSALGMTAAQAKQYIAWTWLVSTPKLVQPFADKAITGQWDPLQKKFDPNTGTGKALADAKKLLASTQWKDGFSLDFWTTSGNPVRQAQEAVAAASWARIGVKVSGNYTTATKLFDSFVNGGVITVGNFQVGDWAYSGTPDPFGWKYNQQSQYIEREKSTHPCVTCSNDAGIHDKLIDKAWNAVSGTLDTKIQQKNLYAIQVEMNKMAYWIPLYYRQNIDTNDGAVAKNWLPNPTQYGAEWNAVHWIAKS